MKSWICWPPSLAHAATQARRASLLGAVSASVGWMLGGCAQTPTKPKAAAGHDVACYRMMGISTCVPGVHASPLQIDSVRAPLARLGAGRIVIVRNSLTDWLGHTTVWLDGQPVQDMIPCSTFGIDVSPGHHVLKVQPSSEAPDLNVEVAAGEIFAAEVRHGKVGRGMRAYEVAKLSKTLYRSLAEECPVLSLLDKVAPGAAQAASSPAAQAASAPDALPAAPSAVHPVAPTPDQH